MRITRFLADPEAVRLPRPPAPAPISSAFALWPAELFPGASPEQWIWQKFLYQRALELAQAVMRPSLLERDLLGVWN